MQFPRLSEIAGIKTEEQQLLVEKKWSAKVTTRWSPPEGFFTKSAEAIATGLKTNHSDLRSAMSSLNFYINRAGKNLSAEDRQRLETAKKKLQAHFKGK